MHFTHSSFLAFLQSPGEEVVCPFFYWQFSYSIQARLAATYILEVGLYNPKMYRFQPRQRCIAALSLVRDILRTLCDCAVLVDEGVAALVSDLCPYRNLRQSTEAFDNIIGEWRFDNPFLIEEYLATLRNVQDVSCWLIEEAGGLPNRLPVGCQLYSNSNARSYSMNTCSSSSTHIVSS